jgi:hypothetical protein
MNMSLDWAGRDKICLMAIQAILEKKLHEIIALDYLEILGRPG